MRTEAETKNVRRTLRRLVDRLDRLPSVPVVAQKVAEMVHDPRQDAGSIAGVMKADPALSAKVLKIVNSPYYGIPGGVSDVTRAISFLGFSTIHELVLTVSVFDVFKDKRSDFSHALFRHSLAAAAAAEAIAQLIGHPAPAECFTAGLLHDLGRLAILQIDDVELAMPDDELHEAVGDRLAGRWRFPVGLRAAIAHHHGIPDEERGKVAKHLHSLIDVTTLADVICKRQGYGVTEAEGRDEPLPAAVLDRLNVMENIETTAHDRLRWNLERSEVLMRVLLGDA